MVANQAAWQCPWNGPLDRPARVTRYDRPDSAKRLESFTAGLVSPTRRPVPLDDQRAGLATGATLRLAGLRGRLDALLPELTPLLSSQTTGADAADAVLLCWHGLCRQRQFDPAGQAIALFTARGQTHPLHVSQQIAAMAMAASAEYARTADLTNPRSSQLRQALGAHAEMLQTWPEAWGDPAVTLHRANCLGISGRGPDAVTLLKGMADNPLYDASWRDYAASVLAGLNPAGGYDRKRRQIAAAYAETGLHIDGKLDDKPWARATPAALLPVHPDRAEALNIPPQATLRAVRQDQALALGLRLKHTPRRDWQIHVAVDADRDTWTQVHIVFGLDGKINAWLEVRNGPTIDLPAGRFTLRGRASPDAVTAELALPIDALAISADQAAIWNLQVQATAVDQGQPPAVLRLSAQADDRMLPRRYAELHLPGKPSRK
jgi:hypothetical protein